MPLSYLRCPRLPGVLRRPSGGHALRRRLWNAHQFGRALLAVGSAFVLAAVLLILIGLSGAAVLVGGLACVLTAAGAWLYSSEDPPASQCDRWLDSGPRSPWANCGLPRGHQGTCEP